MPWRVVPPPSAGSASGGWRGPRREVAATRVRFYSGPERPPALPSDGVIKPGREKSDDEKTVRGGIEVSWVTESAR